MRHWITFHYPRHSPYHPWQIYLRDEFRNKIAEINLHDRVAFFEQLGTERTGARGIVFIAEVTGEARRNLQGGESSADEGERQWEWELPCGNHDSSGFVPEEIVRSMLAREDNQPLRYAGGLVALSMEQFTKLEKSFRSNAPVHKRRRWAPV